ncbi:hypothetical protein [Gordonia sp. CPCC 205333]|uniref:hypothetical protein n=1 Tax=Gordonia sp. CPCC 205333 TaxID=3140790 RepID=UPI003AF3481B
MSAPTKDANIEQPIDREETVDGQSADTRGPRRALTVPLPRVRLDRRRLGLGVAVIAVLALVIGCAIAWRSAASARDDLRAGQADVAAVSELARTYTQRSLTYDYRKLDDFFTAVTTDVTPALRTKYGQVRDTLSEIMTKSQVIATGEILGTSVTASKPDRYDLLVFATQKTQNIQQAEPGEAPNLLKLTVVRREGKWLVDDYASR